MVFKSDSAESRFVWTQIVIVESGDALKVESWKWNVLALLFHFSFLHFFFYTIYDAHALFGFHSLFYDSIRSWSWRLTNLGERKQIRLLNCVLLLILDVGDRRVFFMERLKSIFVRSARDSLWHRVPYLAL